MSKANDEEVKACSSVVERVGENDGENDSAAPWRKICGC